VLYSDLFHVVRRLKVGQSVLFFSLGMSCALPLLSSWLHNFSRFRLFVTWPVMESDTVRTDWGIRPESCQDLDALCTQYAGRC